MITGELVEPAPPVSQLALALIAIAGGVAMLLDVLSASQHAPRRLGQ